jgi:hypothetical protein
LKSSNVYLAVRGALLEYPVKQKQYRNKWRVTMCTVKHNLGKVGFDNGKVKRGKVL